MIEIEIVIYIPDGRDSSIVCRPIKASAQAPGYSVEARFAAWGRNRDGSVQVDITASVRSPAGLTAALQ